MQTLSVNPIHNKTQNPNTYIALVGGQTILAEHKLLQNQDGHVARHPQMKGWRQNTLDRSVAVRSLSLPYDFSLGTIGKRKCK